LSWTRAALGGLTLLVCTLPIPSHGSAQIPSLPSDTSRALQLSEAAAPVSPRGAFLRAMAVPGWGHAAIGSFTRGGFYFFAESAAAWMMVKTRTRLGAAKRVEDFRREQVAERLAAEGVTDPAAIALAQAADSTVSAAGSLVAARSQQFEDWLVLGIFLAFFSGADAFVSAHLRDFPSPVGVQVGPQNGIELRLRLPLGGSAPTDSSTPRR
jgi:hypothetical protein